MNRSDLIDAIAETFKQLPKGDVDLVVRSLLEHMSEALANGERIEIRGFGSFTLHYKPPRQGRNPKSGEPVAVAGRYHPHFKPGKELRERVCPPMPTS